MEDVKSSIVATVQIGTTGRNECCDHIRSIAVFQSVIVQHNNLVSGPEHSVMQWRISVGILFERNI